VNPGPPLSEGASSILERARAEAIRLGHDVLASEHVILAVLQGDPDVRAIFESAQVDTETLATQLASGNRKIRPRGEPPAEGLPLSSHARRLLEGSSGAAAPGTAVMLAALRDRRSAVARFLGERTDEMVRLFGGEPLPPREEKPREPKPPQEKPRQEKAQQERPPQEKPQQERARARDEATRDEKPREPRQREPRQKEQRKEQPRRGREQERERVPEVPLAAKPPSVGKLAPPPKQSIPWSRYVLLAAVPVSIVLNYMHASPTLVFITACLGVLPLAGFMGEATEHLAARTGPTLGGLLNATFGNAAELIIAIVALRAGLVDLVKASITGSILGNLLLITGLSIVAGGVKRTELRFNRTSAGMSAGMLCLAVVSLVLPALFLYAHPEAGTTGGRRGLYLSEGMATLLLLTYAASLWFSLRTHKRLLGGEPHPMAGPIWSVGKAVLVLALATTGVAVESEILVHATEAVTQSFGLSQLFLGLIVIPLIGNAAEHATAIVVARKGQMDLALQIAHGSSVQIALLVAPILVFAGVLMGQEMNLVFQPFEIAILSLATLVSTVVTLDGESNWFEGVQLLAVYGMIAIASWFI
jgi:Ca2+:H+ antiporter